MHFYAVAASAALLTIGVAQAASPSFDCAKAEGEAQKLVCGDMRLAELDHELDRLFNLAQDGAHMTEDRRAELVASERGWIKGRDECWKADDLRTCIMDSYVIRIAELRQGYADARSDDGGGISIGPKVARCEGLDALIAVTFVNGREELPLAYLAWLDRSLVMTLAPSGSGAKYLGTYGDGEAMFWNKGDMALFELPGQKQLNCRLVEPG